MISIALTKKVQTKGRIRVKYSKWVATATANAPAEIKNNNQYTAVFFFCCSMEENLCKSRRNELTNKRIKNEYLRA